MLKKTYLFVVIVVALTAAGCAGVRAKRDYLVSGFPETDRPGIYHKVRKGDTLWRIAKVYDTSIDDIIRTNRIPNVVKIEEDQLVFIPGAPAVKNVVPHKEGGSNGFIWPLQGKILRYFHERNSTQLNKGIDIHAQEGETVRASRRGRVVFADALSGYGYTVILDHADALYSVYAGNAKLLVKLNDLVSQGQGIAQLGRMPAGRKDREDLAYLHFEIRKNAVEDNPLYYLP
jgi:murein DD-endopeptidase MepM/ murein hydrolase activator NlpD